MIKNNHFIIFLCIISLFMQEIASVESRDAIINEESTILVSKTDGTKRSPRLLLFTCNYGSGHKMATQGICESLPDCDVKVIDMYEEPLHSIDPMRDIAPQLSNEQLYNQMIKKECNYLLNFAGKVAPKLLFLQASKIEGLLSQCIAQEKPDLVVSCVPLVNSILLSATKKFNVPLLVITTDIDISAFCYGFENRSKVESKRAFRISVPYSAETWYDRFGKQLPLAAQYSLQYEFGFPTRLSFSKPIDPVQLDELREEYQIDQRENVILVMMGGNTGHAAETYAKLMLSMSNSDIDSILGQNNVRNHIRLLCLCGDMIKEENRSLMMRLNHLNQAKERRNNRVQIYACPGTSKIAELASLPELCTVISKPGGSTVNEMIKKRMPMIYHTSSVSLDWERGNMEYGESRGFGKRFQVSRRISRDTHFNLIKVLSHTFALHQAIQSGKKFVSEAEFDFKANLRIAVQEMLD